MRADSTPPPASSVSSTCGVPRRREVWITSIGVVTAFGVGLASLVRALADNRTAAAPVTSFDPGRLQIRHLAELREPVPTVTGFTDDRKVNLLFAAAEEAARGAGLDDTPDPSRGVFLGTGLSSVTPAELEQDLYPHLSAGRFDRASLARALDIRSGSPHRHLPGRAAAALARRWGARGPVLTSFSACAASAQAIADAASSIRRGEITLALAGGHDSMAHPLGVLSFVLLGTLTDDLCRPFDRRRNGFLLGEGAAVLVLEDAEAARARGARPLARFLGSGTSVDAHAVTAPHPEGYGASLAMVRALQDAGVPPEAVSQVNAHGTGTHVGDRAEALAVARVFRHPVPVCSLKGAVGHTIAAAGAVELAGSIGAMNAGFLPGTTGCDDPDPDCPVHVLTAPQWTRPSIILSNSFGFGGQNASLVISHPDA